MDKFFYDDAVKNSAIKEINCISEIDLTSRISKKKKKRKNAPLLIRSVAFSFDSIVEFKGVPSSSLGEKAFFALALRCLTTLNYRGRLINSSKNGARFF